MCRLKWGPVVVRATDTDNSSFVKRLGSPYYLRVRLATEFPILRVLAVN